MCGPDLEICDSLTQRNPASGRPLLYQKIGYRQVELRERVDAEKNNPFDIQDEMYCFRESHINQQTATTVLIRTPPAVIQ